MPEAETESDSFNETRDRGDGAVTQPRGGTEEPAALTQLGDGVLGDVAREGEGTGEVRRVGSSVVQPEALMLAHLGGGLPGRLYNAAVQHLGDEGGGRRHCNTTNNTAV